MKYQIMKTCQEFFQNRCDGGSMVMPMAVLMADRTKGSDCIQGETVLTWINFRP